jgi:predicted ABC-type ATPase
VLNRSARFRGKGRRLKAEGHKTCPVKRPIPSPELALLRIRDRVESGGHNVPERDVRRRFRRTLGNLFALYRPVFDTLHFFDNYSDMPRLIFKDESGHTTISDAVLYAELRRRFEP